MNTLQVDMLNPKVAKLLKDLSNLKLIAMRDNSNTGFAIILKKLRSKSSPAPTPEEINDEIEVVRAKRYAK